MSKETLLTGKCKEAFEKWYLQNVKHYDTLTVFDAGKLNQFNNLPFQMQYGVYLNFFDSVDIIIVVHPLLDYDENFYTKVLYWIYRVIPLNKEINEDDYDETDYNSRQEAQIESIKKANEIYNSK